MMMPLGAEGSCLSSGVFESRNPLQRAEVIVATTTFFGDPAVIAKVSRGLGEAKVGNSVHESPGPHRLAGRGF